jgi:hypothetical protein
VLRRLRHQSSGDLVQAKRPEPTPVFFLAPAAVEEAPDDSVEPEEQP